MTHRHDLALEVYQHALARLARLAGATFARPAEQNTDLIRRAQSLALPNQRAEEAGTPVLTSILGHLHQGTQTRYYHPQPIGIGRETVIPTAERPPDPVAGYRALWEQVQQELAQIPDDAPAPVREAAMHALLQRFAWAVPAPAGADDRHESDIALFDYARMSAALAVCLDDAPEGGDPVALLVGGDLSGVQDWLYTFGSRGAAKNLRGRSFYLQLLTEVIADFLLAELDLPMANLLYAGGGNLYLLAPPSARDRIDDLQRTISSRLLTMHDGHLYVALGHAPVTAGDLTGGHVGDLWTGVNRGLNRVKNRRFAELDDAAMAKAIGTAVEMDGNPLRTCSVCRRSLREDEKGTRKVDSDGEPVVTCDLCLSFEALGNLLRDAEFLVRSRVAPADAAAVTDWQAGLRQFGCHVQLLPAAEHPKRAEAWVDLHSELVQVFYWDNVPDAHSFPGVWDTARMVRAFRPLAQAVPEDADGKIATFEQLQSEGIKRWGVLRMDVDSLGAIFQHGIPANNLSRVVGLSGLLRLFFEGTVPRLAQAYNKEEPCVYLMYAGGDDLFVVGGWSHLPGLAREIQEHFADFGCGNPRLGISGGISIALAEKYPLYQAARDAEDAETQAKDWPGKNAISLLGQAVPWESDDHRDFRRVESRIQELQPWLDPEAKEPNKLRRSFLQTLRSVDNEWRRWRAKEQGHFAQRNLQPLYKHSNQQLYLGPWQWHLIYQLARTSERSRNKEIKEYVSAYVQAIIGGEIELLGMTSRWLEFVTRKEKST